MVAVLASIGFRGFAMVGWWQCLFVIVSITNCRLFFHSFQRIFIGEWILKPNAFAAVRRNNVNLGFSDWLKWQ
jgi:hypothetical protein